jgi:lipopolysaccharide transport system permease protein
MMAYYHYLPNLAGLLILPLLLLVSATTALGMGLILASVNVKYRDVRYVLPFFLQMLLFITPVIYPSSIAGKYSWILALNPMTGVIEAARSAVLLGTSVNLQLLFLSAGVSLAMLVAGLFYFKKVERFFADIV